MPDIGKIAYDAYCEATGWKSLVSGADLPQWNEVRPEIQAAWRAAGNAVMNRFTTKG